MSYLGRALVTRIDCVLFFWCIRYLVLYFIDFFGILCRFYAVGMFSWCCIDGEIEDGGGLFFNLYIY